MTHVKFESKRLEPKFVYMSYMNSFNIKLHLHLHGVTFTFTYYSYMSHMQLHLNFTYQIFLVMYPGSVIVLDGPDGRNLHSTGHSDQSEAVDHISRPE